MDWTLIWKTMLVIMLGLFAIMAVAGTVFGAFDIRRLLVHLRNPDAESNEDSDE